MFGEHYMEDTSEGGEESKQLMGGSAHQLKANPSTVQALVTRGDEHQGFVMEDDEGTNTRLGEEGAGGVDSNGMVVVATTTSSSSPLERQPMKKPQRRFFSSLSSSLSLRFVVPALCVALFIVMFAWVGVTSGSPARELPTKPRVAVLLFEHFSATAFTELMETEGLPNLRRLLLGNRGSVWATCPDVEDSHCAQAVTVEVTEGGSSSNGDQFFQTYVASSIASILSGVQPSRHGVSNNSLSSILNYASTSQDYPSFASLVKRSGSSSSGSSSSSDSGSSSAGNGGVSVLGTSFLLNSLGESYGCTAPGVLDAECPEGFPQEGGGFDQPLECWMSSSCNTDVRRIHLPMDVRDRNRVVAQEQYSHLVDDLFSVTGSGTAGGGSAAAAVGGVSSTSSLYVFHFDSGSLEPSTANTVERQQQYRAQAYLIDALVGQIIHHVARRSAAQHENWLILGTAAHGGTAGAAGESKMDSASSSTAPAEVVVTPNTNNNHGNTGDIVEESGETWSSLLHSISVPFFMSTLCYSSSGQQPAAGGLGAAPAPTSFPLRALQQPTTLLDVFPTILRWLNVPPYDDVTSEAWEQRSSSSSSSSSAAGSLTPAAAAQLEVNLKKREKYFGMVQGICSSGVSPKDCTSQ